MAASSAVGQGSLESFQRSAACRSCKRALARLDVPITNVVPDEVVQPLRRLGDSEVLKSAVGFFAGALGPETDQRSGRSYSTPVGALCGSVGELDPRCSQ